MVVARRGTPRTPGSSVTRASLVFYERRSLLNDSTCNVFARSVPVPNFRAIYKNQSEKCVYISSSSRAKRNRRNSRVSFTRFLSLDRPASQISAHARRVRSATNGPLRTINASRSDRHPLRYNSSSKIKYKKEF